MINHLQLTIYKCKSKDTISVFMVILIRWQKYVCFKYIKFNFNLHKYYSIETSFLCTCIHKICLPYKLQTISSEPIFSTSTPVPSTSSVCVSSRTQNGRSVNAWWKCSAARTSSRTWTVSRRRAPWTVWSSCRRGMLISPCWMLETCTGLAGMSSLAWCYGFWYTYRYWYTCSSRETDLFNCLTLFCLQIK